MRGVFRLATGVYALGTLIRLLQRRSGAAGETSMANVPGYVSAVPEDAPPTAQAPRADGGGEDDVRQTDERVVEEPPSEEELVMYDRSITCQDVPVDRGMPLRQPSTLDQLPREELFEMAQANGHRLEELITMSRENLINTIAGIEQEERSPINSSDPDKITNRTPPPSPPT